MIHTARQAQSDQDPQCRKISSSDLICWSMYSAGHSTIVDIAEPHHDQNRFESVLGAFFLLVFGLAIAVPRYLHGPIFGDEGFLASGADRVLLGELPNRDFVSLQPPFSFYAVAFVFKFVEPSLAVLRGLGLVLQEAVLLSTYFFATRLTRPFAAALGVAPLAITGMALQKFVPYAVWFGLFWAMLAAGLLLGAVEKRSSRWAVGSAIATAATLLSRHDQGFYLCIAIGSFAVARWFLCPAERPALLCLARVWLACLAAASCLPIFSWVVTGSLPAVMDQLILFPLTRYAETSAIPWPEMGHADKWLPNSLYYLPAVAIAGSLISLAYQLLRAKSRDSVRVAALIFAAALCALFYAQVFARTDLFHLVITLPPCYVLMSLGIGGLDKQCLKSFPGAAPRVAVWATMTLTIAFACKMLAPHFINELPSDARPLELDRGGVWLSEFDAQRFERAARFIDKRVPKDGSILALPYEPIFYFLSERRNPSRWLYLWPGDQTPADHDALIRAAQADPPAIVILDQPEKLRQSAPAILEYVENEFEAVASVRSTVYFVRRSP